MLALLAAALVVVPVTPLSFADAKEAQMAIGRDHHVYVAFGQGDAIYLAKSSDEGSSYSAPIKVSQMGSLSLGMRRGPRIAVNNEIVTITAVYGKQGRGADGDLVAFRSADAGNHWSGPSRVNDVAGSAREGLHSMAMGPDGLLACAWLDLRSKGTKIYLSTSANGGTTWSANNLVYASPSGTVCQCCQPTVQFDAKGKLYVMFRNVIEGARDMYLTSSTDNGQSFSSATKLGTGTWMLNACPMDGGALSFTDTGDVRAIWRRDGVLYESGSQGPEKRIADGSQGWIVGGYRTWSQGNQLLASLPSGVKMNLSTSGSNGVIAESPDEKLVLAAWAENGIKSARLR